MAKYLHIAKITVLQNLAYWGEVLARSLAMVLVMVIFIALWGSAFRTTGQKDLAGFTMPMMAWYLLGTETIVLARSRIWLEIAQTVKSGELAYFLNKPYHFPLFQLAQSAGGQLVLASSNLLIGSVVVIMVVQEIATTPAGLAGYAILLVGAILLDASVSVAIGLLSFFMEEVQPLDWIYNKLVFTIGGMFLPLETFPGWLQQVAGVLPFQFMAYAPAKILVHFTPAGFFAALAGQIIWFGLIWLAISLIYNRGVKQVSIHGG